MKLDTISSMTVNEEEAEICFAVAGVPGTFTTKDILCLHRLASQTPDESLLIEFGSYRGRSTAAIAYAMADSPRVLFSVDTRGHLNDPDWGKFPGTNQVIPLISTTQTLEPLIREKGYALAFIDADHTLEAVSHDIRLALDIVSPGGIICGHDYHPSHTGVRQTVDALFASDKVFETGCCRPGSTIWYCRKAVPENAERMQLHCDYE